MVDLTPFGVGDGDLEGLRRAIQAANGGLQTINQLVRVGGQTEPVCCHGGRSEQRQSPFLVQLAVSALCQAREPASLKSRWQGEMTQGSTQLINARKLCTCNSCCGSPCSHNWWPSALALQCGSWAALRPWSLRMRWARCRAALCWR